MIYINITDYHKKIYKIILKIIFELCSTFRIIDLYGKLNIEKLKIYQDLINVKHSNKWAGTKSKGRKAYIYSFKISKKSIDFFNENDSFFYYNNSGYFCNTGLSDQYDYIFLEKETNDCLMYVTIHEGEIYLRKDIYNKYLGNCKIE